MPKSRLKQLSQDGAADGEVVTWSTANGRWEPAAAGGGGGGVFGTEYHTGESNALSTTTSTSFIEKLKLTTAVVPAGDYYIGWSCELWSSNKEVELQVQLDASEVLQVGISKIKGGFHEIHGGFAVRTLTNAAHDIDIDFRDTGSGSTANIEKARLVFWRVT